MEESYSAGVAAHFQGHEYTGQDVATLFKVCQVGPSGGAVADMQYELTHPNHGIITFVRCKPLEWVEKHGSPTRQKQMCDMDQEFFDRWAHLLNPRMRVTALKLPPRRSKDDIACVWEFRVEELWPELESEG